MTHKSSTWRVQHVQQTLERDVYVTTVRWCCWFRDFKGLAPLSTFESLEVLDLRGNPLSDFGIVVSLLHTVGTFNSFEFGNPNRESQCGGFVSCCCASQAEGFALLCCHTLRQLNGRTVSADVREAVDTWAVDDMCGRATAATVEAFRDALLHPDGK